MISQNRLRFALLLSSAVGVTTFACGGISDPTRHNGAESVATVSGALTGTAVPANARVALVYRKITTDSTGTHGSVEVGSDVPVVGGAFTMNLPVPAADYFGPLSTSGVAATDVLAGNSGSAPPSLRETKPAPAPAGGSGGSAFDNAAKLSPRDTAVGGSITEPMTAALAGFVVYADTNGNGKLDLEGQYASSPDQILGGNRELTLAYLKGGGALDYEKLRDKSGILPAAGFNLAWSEGRWLPLTVVELKLDAKASLPSSVCNTYISSNGSSPGGSGGTPAPDAPSVAVPTTVTDGGKGGGGSTGSAYPSPTDPTLNCSADGRSYTYTPATSGCGPTPPAPVGLCAGGDTPLIGCAEPSGYNSLYPGQPTPAGWPCPVAGDHDGGAADASVHTDAGTPVLDGGF
jgi:hypothetical protein